MFVERMLLHILFGIKGTGSDDQWVTYPTWSSLSKQEKTELGVYFTEKEKFEGMYSFVPCKVGDPSLQGFERIHLQKNDIDVIINSLSQGQEATESDFATNKIIWQKICNIVKSQGCLNGVSLSF